MNKVLKLYLLFALVFFLVLAAAAPSFHVQAASGKKMVYVIPVQSAVEKGLYAFLKRGLTEAEEQGASLVVFDIHTPGGTVDAATDIGKVISEAEIDTIAFVNKQALSAGAFIALNADQIYMASGATIGSAAVINQQGNAADKKAQSFWNAAMKSAAEQRNRDPIYALAMADESIDLPEYNAGKGKLLTLTSEQAVEVGYSEGTASTLKELLEKLNYKTAEVIHIQESFAEKTARFVTHPVVVPILLSIGSLGLIIELYSPGFGVAGTMGLVSLLVFFYGHTIAGLAGIESVILFIGGIVLVVLEFFLVGGIAGIIGFAAIIASFFMATDNYVHMGISLLIAAAIAAGGAYVMMKFFKKRFSAFQKVVLSDSMKTEEGYVSNRNRTDLLGKEGVAVTPLRPAGTVLVDDEYVDVVTEGNYVALEARVKIVKVEGAKIVVRKLQ